ncbi:MAG: molybdopterin-dependent oxidoreductase, partial [Candidatus Eremiobacterota bacterium]
MGALGLTMILDGCTGQPQEPLSVLTPVEVGNPLKDYPDREWEKAYRDLAKVDSSFVFLCAPNDTHNCLLRAHVKNGVVVRISPTYGYGKATDLYGTRPSHRWDPRCCQKGIALARRFYGDRRVKAPMVRKGFKDWADQGFPRDPETGAPPPEFFRRGFDTFVRVSWDEALDYSARALVAIATAYNGEKGQEFLRRQGYDEECVQATGGAGVQVLKFRGGMPLLGATRIMSQYRMANSMALLDAKLRGLGPDDAVGARGFDNYSWHTDLPPGHPMVTGQQTLDWDLASAEHSKVLVVWGMNWITTKMPDSHWLTEARLKGTRVVVIACEYSATACKGDDVIVVRPGTTPALALGLAHVLFQEKLFDVESLKAGTDLPLLVRMDTGKLLRAAEVFPDHKPFELTNYLKVLGKDDKPPKPFEQDTPLVKQELRDRWGDFVVWDEKKKAPAALSRDWSGKAFAGCGLSPALTGSYPVRLVDGKTVTVTPVFVQLEAMARAYTPEVVSEITWAPGTAIVELARLLARHRGESLLAVGMGPNQFFNNDLKDRLIFLVAALTGNIGKFSGNVGSYAGNYRAAQFNGLPSYINENPFQVQTDPAGDIAIKQYWKPESAHYFNH